ISSVTIRGPSNATGSGETPSRVRIFTCRPAPGNNNDNETACAKDILGALARRAYRRPITNADLSPLLDLYKAGRKDGSFEEGIQIALRGILVSPGFLFRIERDPPKTAPGAVYRISDIELASRLSFF